VVNIDNGFGAAYIAVLIARATEFAVGEKRAAPAEGLPRITNDG
jgi:hypothetical protein